MWPVTPTRKASPRRSEFGVASKAKPTNVLHFPTDVSMTLLALANLNSGVCLSMVCAVVGLGFAFFLIASIKRSSPGNERMRQIAGAVQEGAKAYLHRQVVTISAIAAIIFVLLFIYKDHATAVGFVIGAFCSLSAGYIGMNIAVLANVRTAQAASHSRLAALRIASYAFPPPKHWRLRGNSARA